jgi:hypothetical protein
MRLSIASITVLALTVLLATDATAKRKRKPAKQKNTAPVSVDVTNNCKRPMGLKIGSKTIKLNAGETSGSKVIKSSKNNAYEYTFVGAKREPGYVFFEAGGKYAVRIHSCGKSWANLDTRNLGPRPKGISPNAAAHIRFRSFRIKGQRLPNIEYRSGKRGRFKRLSVAFTPYIKSPGGGYNFGLKLKHGRTGPVLKMLNSQVKVEPGKNYLIEAVVVNGEVLIKFEDEGYPRKK